MVDLLVMYDVDGCVGKLMDLLVVEIVMMLCFLLYVLLLVDVWLVKVCCYLFVVLLIDVDFDWVVVDVGVSCCMFMW